MDASQPTKNKLSLHYVNGLPLPTRFPRKCFEETMSLQAQSGDIFLAGYPKTGTTWTQYIIWDIINNGAPLPNVNDVYTKLFPHLEMVGTSELSSLSAPRLLKVNLPFKYTPYHPSSKYVYTIRNPYDTCVSYYNFLKEVDSEFNDATFDEFFDSFMDGDVGLGDYFEHVLSWYDHWNDQNFLFVSYENMRQNPHKSVLQIAAFLDKSYYDRLSCNPDVLTTIIKNTSFDHMKEHCSLRMNSSVSSSGAFYDEAPSEASKTINFFRKGSVGGWKSYFTDNQIKRMKEQIQDKLQGTEILSFWENLNLPQ